MSIKTILTLAALSAAALTPVAAHAERVFPPELYEVMTSMPYYEGPSRKSQILGMLYTGNTLTVRTRKDGWCEFFNGWAECDGLIRVVNRRPHHDFMFPKKP